MTTKPTTSAAPSRAARRVAMGSCAALLLLFAVLSGSAARQKSATYDEPLHVLAGYVRWILGDFRMNVEDPVLFGYWAAVPHGSTALTIPTRHPYWSQMIDDFATNQWPFVWLTLYRTPGNDGDRFLQTSRVMFVLVGVALGAVIAWWSWQLAGAGAAVIATALYALDPNVLAHSALVKNDVMLSLMFAGLALALWRFGRRGGGGAFEAIVLTAAAAVNVKFSGVLSGPVIVLAVAARAVMPQDWTVLGRTLNTRGKRLLVVPAACAIVALGSVAAIWACYGFRFAPTHDPTALLNTSILIERARANTVKAGYPDGAVLDAVEFQKRYENTKPGLLADVVVWATGQRLLPQAWLHGFLSTYVMTLTRKSYLLGEVRHTGWWYYFPCAMLFKTPTATLVAMPMAMIGALLALLSRRRDGLAPSASSSDEARLELAGARRGIDPRRGIDLWSVLCLALPVLIYAVGAMTTNLNLGLRHILPVYPFLFIALGIGLARLIHWKRAVGTTVALLLVAGVAGESLRAYPDFIPFFNTPSGGQRGGYALLGDSNLDWGQDLKRLAEWQRGHTDRRLYLAYFGIADPAFYGVRATHLPQRAGGYPFTFSSEMPSDMPSYLAVSVTNLQQIYITEPFYAELAKQEPIAVLGGSIYVYELPPARPPNPHNS